MNTEKGKEMGAHAFNSALALVVILINLFSA